MVGGGDVWGMEKKGTDEFAERLFARIDELVTEENVSRQLAYGIADFEQRIEQWPAKWGNDLVILIYGNL